MLDEKPILPIECWFGPLNRPMEEARILTVAKRIQRHGFNVEEMRLVTVQTVPGTNEITNSFGSARLRPHRR